MTRTTLMSGLCAAVLWVPATSALAIDVDVTITVDNAYGFGFGDVNGMTTYFGGLRNVTAGEIFNGAPQLYTAGTANAGNNFTNPGVGPEMYQLTGINLTDYLYLVTWSDDGVFQGAIASFQVGGSTVQTGSTSGWEVYATGRDHDSNVPADTLTTGDLGLINAQIATANAAAGTSGATSIGWVDENGLLPTGAAGEGLLVFGEDNTSGSTYAGADTFPVISGIASDSQWMWYNESPQTIPNPFVASSGSPPAGPDGHREFLIFRIPLASVAVPEPSSLMLLICGCACIAVASNRRRKAAR